MNKKGITLVALVVTIIVILILVGVTLAITLGPDGVIEKSKRAKVDNKFAAIIDKVKVRESAALLSYEKGETFETEDEFITRIFNLGLLDVTEDYYDSGLKILYIGKDSNDDPLYAIKLSISFLKDLDLINTLPDSNKLGNEYLKDMILRVRTTTPNYRVSIPIDVRPGRLTICWNSQNNEQTDQFIPIETIIDYDTGLSAVSNVYATPGEYIVKIRGNLNKNPYDLPVRIGLTGDDFYKSDIIKIDSWGENGFTIINNLSKNLEGEIPIPSKKSFESCLDLGELFGSCFKLTGEIPENLFANCPNVNHFYKTFAFCQGLTGTIPEKLFINCSNVKSFNNTFSYCTSLTGISTNLFSNCQDIDSFQSTFYNCTGLIGIAPDLWNTHTKVIIKTACFYNCNGLSNYNDIPPEWKYY